MDWLATPRIPILVPRRADHGDRDRIWTLIQDRVWRFANIVEGHHDNGPFNRAAALNTASDLADRIHPWRTAVIADADSFIHPNQLAGAIRLAEQSGRLVIAHSEWVNIEPDETMRLLDEGWTQHRDNRLTYNFTVSSMLVIPRTVWDTVNGLDERFEGWGCEDRALARAARVLTGEPLRIHGPVYHLQHSRPTEDTDRHRSPLFQANNARWRYYQQARTPEAMQQLVAGNRTSVPA